MSELAVVDAVRLSELEEIVERGLATFVEVGEALMEIRDSDLYLDSHLTFDAYCRERWEMQRAHAYRLIQSASVASALSPMGDTPKSERQARELAPLLAEPEILREAWAEVVGLHPDPTARDVRDVVKRRMDVHYSSSTDDWSTPQDLFDILDAEFGFTLDVCATPDNAKCSEFFTAADDGLAQQWRGVCWMNPPYGDGIGKWVAKAYESSLLGTAVVCLVPGRIDTSWFWEYCLKGEVRILRGRLKFGGGDNSAPFPSIVVVFPAEPRIFGWQR